MVALNLEGQVTQIPFFWKDTINIEYFNKGDTLPKNMNITGEIIGVSQGTSCGIFQSSGTLKIRLKKKNKAYRDSFLYIVISCLTMSDELIGKKVSIKVKALYLNNKKCLKPILNKFNSDGTPFYWLSPMERKKFYHQVKLLLPPVSK